MIKRLCIFCGSSPGARESYANATKVLARSLGERNIGIVYGGANVGLMGMIDDYALERGGEVIGVIPRVLTQKEISHPGLSELHTIGFMHERKAMMAALADGFVALPGGLGTLE